MKYTSFNSIVAMCLLSLVTSATATAADGNTTCKDSAASTTGEMQKTRALGNAVASSSPKAESAEVDLLKKRVAELERFIAEQKKLIDLYKEENSNN